MRDQLLDIHAFHGQLREAALTCSRGRLGRRQSQIDGLELGAIAALDHVNRPFDAFDGAADADGFLRRHRQRETSREAHYGERTH